MGFGQSWPWAMHAGGTSFDEGTASATDAAGNTYITGYFYGTATFGPTVLTSAGNSDVFVAKLAPNGTFLWARRAGGNNDDHGLAIAVDAAGNVAITGGFGSEEADFGATTLVNADYRGFTDVFVARLSSAGTWQWARSAGGTVTDVSNGIGMDGAGNVVIAGNFEGLEIIFGQDTLTRVTNNNLFVVKLNRAGTWQWARQAGGTTGRGSVTAVAVTAGGAVAITGFFSGTAASFGATTLPNASPDYGYTDAFVARLTAGGTWQWARRLGDTGNDAGRAIAFAADDRIVVGGEFQGRITLGASTLVQTGFRSHIFVAQLSSAGSWEWAERAGGYLESQCRSVAVDQWGNVVLGATCTAVDYTFGTSSFTMTDNSFVARLTSTGAWQHVAGIGGTGSIRGVAVDGSGNVTCTGVFGGAPAQFGSRSVGSYGSSDAFAAHLVWSAATPRLAMYHIRPTPAGPQYVPLNYRAAGALKVAADASAGTRFTVARTSSAPLAVFIQENAANTSSAAIADVTGYLSDLTVSADSITAVYHHPAVVDSLTLRYGLHLDVVDNTHPAAQVILASYPIAVVQPPLLLVHGLWSTGEAAFPGLKARLVAAGLYERESQIRYANYPSDRALASNAHVFIAQKQALLQAYLDEHVSASQVDIIGHSMGGLLSRQYIQSTAYQHDVHKLITLNTPHSGSPMANFLGLLPPPATAVLKGLQHDPTAGAVEDLRYTSPALRSLNEAPDTKGVAVHALGTHITLNPLLPLQALLNGQFSYGGFLAGWAALTYPTVAADVNHFLTTDVFRSRHDLVVGINSQCGGLDSTVSSPVTTLFGGQWHGSGGTPAVQQRMAELLRANTRSAAFATGGFHPLPITSIFPRAAASAGPVASTSNPRTTTVLRILAPTRTTALVDADSLHVQIDAGSDITKVVLVCGAGTPQLYTRLLDAGTRTGYIRVPRGVVGRLQVAAFGFADSVYQQFDTLSVAVNTAASLTGLRVTPAEAVVVLACR